MEEVRQKLEQERQSWANAEGFLEREGRHYAHRNALQKELRVTRKMFDAIIPRLEKIEGKSVTGRNRTFYLVEDVRLKIEKWRKKKQQRSRK